MSAAMEKAYSALRNRILDGVYLPGSRLKERELCAELDVSRTPVREALRRLEADGLVRLEPRRGGVVAELSPEEANEIFSLGAVLESFAAGLAAKRANAVDLDGLFSLIESMELLLDQTGTDVRVRYMKLDHELHGGIVSIAGNQRLAAMLKQTVGLPVLAQAFHQYSESDLRRSHDQHKTIVEAISAGDSDWAESAMRCHILVSRSLILPRSD